MNIQQVHVHVGKQDTLDTSCIYMHVHVYCQPLRKLSNFSKPLILLCVYIHTCTYMYMYVCLFLEAIEADLLVQNCFLLYWKLCRQMFMCVYCEGTCRYIHV